MPKLLIMLVLVMALAIGCSAEVSDTPSEPCKDIEDSRIQERCYYALIGSLDNERRTADAEADVVESQGDVMQEQAKKEQLAISDAMVTEHREEIAKLNAEISKLEGEKSTAFGAGIDEANRDSANQLNESWKAERKRFNYTLALRNEMITKERKRRVAAENESTILSKEASQRLEEARFKEREVAEDRRKVDTSEQKLQLAQEALEYEIVRRVNLEVASATSDERARLAKAEAQANAAKAAANVELDKWTRNNQLIVSKSQSCEVALQLAHDGVLSAQQTADDQIAVGRKADWKLAQGMHSMVATVLDKYRGECIP